MLRTCPRGWCFRDTAALLHLHSTRSSPLLAQREPARPVPQWAAQVALSPCSSCFCCVPAPSPATSAPQRQGCLRHTRLCGCLQKIRSLPPPPGPPALCTAVGPAVWLLSVLGEPCGCSWETCLPARSRLGLAPSSIAGHFLHPLGYCVSFIRRGLAQSESPSSRTPLSPLPTAVGVPFMRAPLFLAAPAVDPVQSVSSVTPVPGPMLGLESWTQGCTRSQGAPSSGLRCTESSLCLARVPASPRVQGLPSAQRCRDFTVETQIHLLRPSSWQGSYPVCSSLLSAHTDTGGRAGSRPPFPASYRVSIVQTIRCPCFVGELTCSQLTCQNISHCCQILELLGGMDRFCNR